MQSEKKYTKYLKANDDSEQLQRALNYLIILGLGVDYKSGLGGDYNPVVESAEALSILDFDTFLSVDTWLCFLQRE